MHYFDIIHIIRMEALFNEIKNYIGTNNIDDIKLENNEIYLYVNGVYTNDFLSILNKYGENHHLRLIHLYVTDTVCIDKLFIARFVTSKKRPYKFIIYN